MANEPSQYPNPVASGGMGSPDSQSFGGGGMAGWDINSLREALPQPTPRTNSIRNNSMQGAAIGTPGTLPTNWAILNSVGGTATTNIVNLTSDSGVDCIDLNIFGTAAAAGVWRIAFETPLAIVATPGQDWTTSVYSKMLAGSLNNIAGNIQLGFETITSGGALINSYEGGAVNVGPTLQRSQFTAIAVDGTTAAVRPTMVFNVAAAGPFNITLRLGWPQCELGPGATTALRTTAAAVTRSTNGATRQPYLGSPPAVVSISGFGGAGAGAMILNNGSDADRSQGLVSINVGPGSAGSGTIVLNFPAGVSAGQYVVSGEWLASAVLGVSGSQLTITWTANRPFVLNEDLLLAYQWATST